MEIRFRSGPELAEIGHLIWMCMTALSPDTARGLRHPGQGRASNQISPPQWPWAAGQPRGRPRDRERGLHPAGPRDHPAQRLEAAESSASGGSAPCTQFCPSRRQHLRVDKGGSSITMPNVGSLFLLQYPSLFSTASNLSAHPQQQTPTASPLPDISMMYGRASQTWCTPLQTCSSLPHLCALECQSPSCSDKTSKNYSWFLSLSHILHQPCSKSSWLHLWNIAESHSLLKITALAKSPNQQLPSLDYQNSILSFSLLQLESLHPTPLTAAGGVFKKHKSDHVTFLPRPLLTEILGPVKLVTTCYNNIVAIC